MLAMIGLGVLGLREFFRMTARARPLMLPAYLAVAAMIVAAHYGTRLPDPAGPGGALPG